MAQKLRKKRRMWSLFTVFVMLFTLLSGFTVNAEEEQEDARYGFVTAYAKWDGDQYVFQDYSEFNYDLGINVKDTGIICLAWKAPDGTITPIGPDNMADVTIKDSGWNLAQDVIFEQAYNETWDGETVGYEPAEDGVYELSFAHVGEYSLVYSGDETKEAVPDGREMIDEIGVHVGMPLIALYDSEEASEDSLLGGWADYTLSKRVFYLNIDYVDTDTMRTKVNKFDYEVEVTGSDTGNADYKIEEIGEYGLKITLGDEFDQNLQLWVDFDVAFDEYIDGDWFEVRRDWTEGPMQFVINQNYPERFGLSVAWINWDGDTPTVDEEWMDFDLYGVWAKNQADVALAWKNLDGEYSPIPVEDMNRITVYDPAGNDVTKDVIAPCTRWNDEAQEDETVGDGFFSIMLTEVGTYKVQYAMLYQGSGELMASQGDENYITNSVKIHTKMPAVAVCDSEEMTPDSVLVQPVKINNNRVYYVNTLDVDDGAHKTVRSIEEYSFHGSLEGWSEEEIAEVVTLEETKNGGLKVTISDDWNDFIDMDIAVKVQNFFWSSEEEDWLDEGEWTDHFWVNFQYDEPEYFGLVADWTWWNEDQPVFQKENLRNRLSAGAMTDGTISFGWKHPNGEITPIPYEDVFAIYVEKDGEEIESITVGDVVSWNEETHENEPLETDGFFHMNFHDYPGIYSIVYDTELLETEAENLPEGAILSAEIPLYLNLPDVALYSSEASDPEALIGHSACYTWDENVFYIHAVSSDEGEILPDRNSKNEREISNIEFHGQKDGQDVEDWSDLIEVETLDDGCLKLTVLEDDLYVDIRVVYNDTHYHREGSEWVEDDDGEHDCWMRLYPPQAYGLSINWPYWEDGEPVFTENEWNGYLHGFSASSTQIVTLGWVDAYGNVSPIPLSELDQIVVRNKNSDVMEGAIAPAGYWDHEEEQWVTYEMDGVFELRLEELGEYTISYNGALAVQDEDAEDMYMESDVYVETVFPPLGAYRQDTLSEDSFIGSTVTFTPKYREFYLLFSDEMNERDQWVRSYPDVVTCNFESDFISPEELIEKVSVEKAEGGYKVTIDPELNVNFSMSAPFIDTHSYMTEGGEWETDGENYNDAWFSFVFDDPDEGDIEIEVIGKNCEWLEEQEDPNITLNWYPDTEDYDFVRLIFWPDNFPEGTTTLDDWATGDYILSVLAPEEVETADYIYTLDKKNTDSETLVTVVKGQVTKVTVNITYNKEKKKKYSEEWVDGLWYNKDGSQTYKPKGSWRREGTKWWFGDTKGWYAKKEWVKIDGKSYYFDAKGYLVTGAYQDGYYLDAKTGAWDGKGKASWKGKAGAYWYSLPGGGYLKSCWMMIDGKWYYFKPDGYAACNEWYNNYWFNKDCTQTYKPKGSWRKYGKKWWFGDTSGWFAKSEKLWIDGAQYEFDAEGYLIEK